MRTLFRLLVSVAVLAALASPAAAQLRSVGFQAGMVQSRPVRERTPGSRTHRGPLLGVFVDPQTPRPWLSVLAEMSWVQRGGSYDLKLPLPSGTAGPVTEQIRTDYLAFAVAPTFRLSAGPLSLFGYAGPSTDILLRSRTSTGLGGSPRANDQVLSAVTGGGLQIATSGGRTIRAEVRMNWGLTTAYRSDAEDIRFRSLEFVVRWGRHPLG